MSGRSSQKPYFHHHNASSQTTITPETARATNCKYGDFCFSEESVPDHEERTDYEECRQLLVQFQNEESASSGDTDSYGLSKCGIVAIAQPFGPNVDCNIQIFKKDGVFRGDVEPPSKSSAQTLLHIVKTQSASLELEAKRKDTAVQEYTDQQSSGYSSTLSHPSQIEYIMNALSCVVVNVLSTNELEKSYCPVIFDMKQLFETSSIPELLKPEKLRLTQVIGINGPSQFSWITQSEPVSDYGMEAIVSNSTSAPLLVVVPIHDRITMEAALWVRQLTKLLVSVNVSSQAVVFLGIYKLETTLKQSALDKLGVQTDHIFWLSDSADSSQVLSVCDEIRSILIKSVGTSQRHLLEIERLIVLERYQKRKLMSLTNLLPPGDITDLIPIGKHLEEKGLVASFPIDAVAQSTKERPGFISAASSWSGSEGQIILEPKTFSDEVTKLMTSCDSAYIEINKCLIPSAQHGLIPKSKLETKIDATEMSVFQILHRSGILLDPLLAGGGHLGSSEKPHTLNKAECNETDARCCYLVPSCLEEESFLLPLLQYHEITPLVFRSPGCYRRNIPLSLFYQLVAYLMYLFPSSVKCSRYGARFHIAPQRILDITYSEMYIEVIAYFHETVQMASKETCTIYDNIRTMIGEYLTTLSKAAGSITLHPAALIEDCAAGCPDFVDLSALNPLSGEHELISVGGQLFSPPHDFFLWFGRFGQEPSTIQKRFCGLTDLIDAECAAGWLYQTEFLDGLELDQILIQDRGSRCQLLLRLLEKKGQRGLEAVNAVIQQNLLKTNMTYSVHLASQQTFQKSSTWHEVASQLLPVEATKIQLTVDEYQHELPSGQKSLTMVDIQRRNVQPVFLNKTGTREQTLNQRTQGSNITTRENLTPRTSSPGSLSSYHPLGDDNSRQNNQNDRVLPPSALPVTNPVLSSPTTTSSQQTRPVTATSSSTTYTGLHQEELVFPRNLILPESSITRSSHHKTEAQLPVESQRVAFNVKRDPEIHPIFESKYWHVERATGYFNDTPLVEGGKRLGAGSFSTVYHGTLHSEGGQKFEVAVKRLKKASSLNPAQVEISRKQFGIEMKILTQYIHKNIVHLVGFSSDGPELCLIYEYMQNGALSHRLDCKDKSAPLDWKVRLTIARDIASALEFLHTAYHEPVIHRDVKSANVLLGATFEAKLSDFGLAVIGSVEGDLQMDPASQISVGTRPYMSPEAFQRILTTKVDVYSFGMILLELATGLPPFSNRKKQDLITYMESLEQQNINMTKMLDPKARWPKGRNDTFGLELLELAKLASTRDLNRRPDITEILPKLISLTRRVELK
jgi:hypothetical protein